LYRLVFIIELRTPYWALGEGLVFHNGSSSWWASNGSSYCSFIIAP
jgi:hypothetical protein